MLNYIKNYILSLRYVKLLSYNSAKLLQQSRQESHAHRYTYYYGFQIIYGAINKGLLLITIGLLFNILPQLLLVTLSFSSLRVWSGGLHFDLYAKCVYVSLLTFAILALLSKYIFISTPITIAILSIVFLLFLLLAPVEHKNRPLKQKEKKKFKIISILALIILTCIVLNTNSFISNPMVYGVALAGLITIPIINKLK